MEVIWSTQVNKLVNSMPSHSDPAGLILRHPGSHFSIRSLSSGLSLSLISGLPMDTEVSASTWRSQLPENLLLMS
jgi:hypothetical protein